MKIRAAVFALVALLFIAARPAPAQDGELTLTLEDCLRLALERNPFYLAAAEQESGARSQVHAAAARFFPSLNAQGTQTLDEKPLELIFPSLVPGQPAQRVDVDFTRDYQLSLSFSLPLFAGGRLVAGYKQADFNLKATRESIRQSRQQTVFNVKQAFYGYLLSREFASVAQESLALAERHHENVKNLYEVGLASKFDLLRAEVQAANLRPQLIRARNSLDVAELGLKTLLGLDLERDIAVVGELKFTPAEPDAESAVVAALESRPELVELAYRQRMAGEMVKMARGAYLPTLALGGAYNYWADRFNFREGTWSNYYAISLNLSVSLFNGFETRAQVGQARSALRQLELTRRGTVETVKFEVRQAVLNYRQARETLLSQEKNVEQAKEAVRIAELNFKEGLATGLDVSTAQVALSQAQTNYAQALYDTAVSLAQLELAMGAGMPGAASD